MQNHQLKKQKKIANDPRDTQNKDCQEEEKTTQAKKLH